MPEGPEAKIFAYDIRKRFLGKYLLEIVNTGNNKKHNLQDWDGIPKPIRLIDVFSIGKKVILKLGVGEPRDTKTFKKRKGEYYIMAEFGFSGKFLLKRSDHSDLKFLFGTSGKCGDCEIWITEPLYFDDSMKWGGIRIYRDLTEGLKNVGIDLFTDPGSELWLETLRSERNGNKQIGKFLLDQKPFAGVGNYIRAEVLYMAKISPFRYIKDISDKKLVRLYDSIQKVLWESFKCRGMSIQFYTDLKGKYGDYEKYLKVYDKDIDPDGNEVVKDDFPKGRTIYWVPEVQK